MRYRFRTEDIVKIVHKGSIDWVDGMDKYINGTYKIKAAIICGYEGYSLTSLIEGEDLGYIFCEDSLKLISESIIIKEKGDWNTKCPRCKASAYMGLNSIECSRGCK